MNAIRFLIAAALFAAAVASAQTSPSVAEVAAYAGLHAAAHKGELAVIEKLVAAGAKLNERDAHGRTPLHVAAFAGRRDAIRALAKAGADLSLRGKGAPGFDNQTAYDLAVGRGMSELAVELLPPSTTK